MEKVWEIYETTLNPKYRNTEVRGTKKALKWLLGLTDKDYEKMYWASYSDETKRLTQGFAPENSVEDLQDLTSLQIRGYDGQWWSDWRHIVKDNINQHYDFDWLLGKDLIDTNELLEKLRFEKIVKHIKNNKCTTTEDSFMSSTLLDLSTEDSVEMAKVSEDINKKIEYARTDYIF